MDVSVLGLPWIDGARDIKRRVASGESARVIAGDYERIKEPFIEQMRVGTILAHVRQVAPNRIPGLALKRPRGDEYSSSREPHAWALRNRREYWIRLLRSCSQAERDALAVSARDTMAGVCWVGDLNTSSRLPFDGLVGRDQVRPGSAGVLCDDGPRRHRGRDRSGGWPVWRDVILSRRAEQAGQASGELATAS